MAGRVPSIQNLDFLGIPSKRALYMMVCREGKTPSLPALHPRLLPQTLPSCVASLTDFSGGSPGCVLPFHCAASRTQTQYWVWLMQRPSLLLPDPSQEDCLQSDAVDVPRPHGVCVMLRCLVALRPLTNLLSVVHLFRWIPFAMLSARQEDTVMDSQPVRCTVHRASV